MAAEGVPTPRSTGIVVGRVRAVLLAADNHWIWYRRNWRATVFSSLVSPALLLVALGFGFGSQVEAGPVTDGLPYVRYLAPALLVATAVQNAAWESTYAVLGSFKWQRVYWAVACTPLTPGQIAGGQLAWIAMRLSLIGTAFLVVAAALGVLTSPAVLLSLVIAVLAGMALSAPIVAYSATIDDEGQKFGFLFRFVVLPMTLVAGTFYPVDQLPPWVRPLAWVTPLWHGTELSRGVAFGQLRFWPGVGHVLFLVALIALGTVLAVRNYRRRLAG
jgi:lipooligosaccharide transport system permease protein